MILQKLEKFFVRVVWPRNQIICLIITSLLTIIMAYYAMIDFRDIEPSPELHPITPQKLAEWVGEPTVVKTGLHIINFPEFDMVHNDFLMDGIIWFEFDPALVSLETIGKFSFEKGDIKIKSEPDTKLIDTKLFAEYKIRIHFSSNLSYQFFPLDDHRIYISLINSYVSPSEIIFEAEKSGFSLSEEIYLGEWKQIDYGLRTGYSEALLEKHDVRKMVRNPKVVFSIDFSRTGIRQGFLILLPLFLIFFIGLFSLGFDPKTHAREVLTLPSGSITSMIAYRFVIQRMSPQLGYFILSDHVFTLFLIFAFLEFIIGVLIVRKGISIRWWSLFRGLAFVLFHFSFLLMWYFLLFHWIS